MIFYSNEKKIREISKKHPSDNKARRVINIRNRLYAIAAGMPEGLERPERIAQQVKAVL